MASVCIPREPSKKKTVEEEYWSGGIFSDGKYESSLTVLTVYLLLSKLHFTDLLKNSTT